MKKVIRRRKKERKIKKCVKYSTLTIFITTVTLNGTTIGDKVVETLYSNRVTSENKINYTPPLHSKETTPLLSIQKKLHPSSTFKVGVFVLFYR